MISLQMLRDAINQAQGQWRGCDWKTEFGPRAFDLKGLRSQQAVLASKATSGAESRCWLDAARWLEEVEGHAEQAAKLAEQAFRSAQKNDFGISLRLLSEAAATESSHGQSHAYGEAREVCKGLANRQPPTSEPAPTKS